MRYSVSFVLALGCFLGAVGSAHAECAEYAAIPAGQDKRCSASFSRSGAALQSAVCPSTLLQNITVTGACYAGPQGALTTIIEVFCRPASGAQTPQNLDQISFTNVSGWCWEPLYRPGGKEIEGVMVYSKK
jgi:hypothetical protein